MVAKKSAGVLVPLPRSIAASRKLAAAAKKPAFEPLDELIGWLLKHDPLFRNKREFDVFLRAAANDPREARDWYREAREPIPMKPDGSGLENWPAGDGEHPLVRNYCIFRRIKVIKKGLLAAVKKPLAPKRRTLRKHAAAKRRKAKHSHTRSA